MTLPAAFLEDLRQRIPMAALVGRKVRLARSSRNWKGCCPFHGEKTPSFYVYDDHFHCFGCGAHGDAISFVMQSDGLSFMDAVETLASQAGLHVPRPTPQAAVADQRRRDLHQVMEAAVAAYRRRLFLPSGQKALAYLDLRGLTRDTIAKWGLGWSDRGGLRADLAREGITAEQLLACGLLRQGDDGALSDLFFNRVMFPIRDARGRVVSFGGRVLGDGQPKYVNGPETELFSKRHTLYGLDQARAGLRGNRLLVVEGYTDVLALHQAGFTGAVAPLGTALTGDQLGLLWRLSPTPVLCFDGDAAGRRAAARVLDLALPMLGVDRGLDFLTLAPGDDPDSLIRRGGAGAFRSALDGIRPLSWAGFDLLRHPGGETTAELRVALRARLVDAAGRIPDPALALEIRRSWLARLLTAPVDVLASGVDDSDVTVDTNPAEALFAHCAATWPLPTTRAHERLRELGVVSSDIDLAPLIVAAPVQEHAGGFSILDERRPRARDWRFLVAVRDGAPNPDYSEAGMAETARQSVQAGRIVDLVACDPDLMRVTGRLLATTAVLGWPQHPDLVSDPVRLSETPNAWFRDGCQGAVLIGDDDQVQDWLLRCPRGVTAGAVPFARALDAKLKRAGKRQPEVFVRQAA